MHMGGQVLLSIRFYLYRKQASAIAGQVDSWQARVNQHFPQPSPLPLKASARQQRPNNCAVFLSFFASPLLARRIRVRADCTACPGCDDSEPSE